VIDLEAGRALLDFEAGRIAPQRADEQLRGAVALHNILRKHRVAYLADEVGMGKTYVALGAVALFRHFDPAFRVLVIAPRENIQRKWQKELRNFTSNNVRIDDLRVRSPDGRPARALVSCGNLIELIHEASLDPDRDFFLRMTSFSLPLGKSGEDWKRIRDGLRRHLPWLRDEAFDLRSKEAFKTNFGRALCCALPEFDLVIVDEAHNLKHGFSIHGSARNQVLAEAFGRHPADDPPDRQLFPNHGRRARRVLFLSATPLEESYRHIWNQLDLFGLGEPFAALKRDDLSEEEKKTLASEFLVRRVTSIKVMGEEHTKNMYRREWRSGGVAKHDDPIRVEDERQRLIVALVQKKVSELLSGKRFNRSFQIGMLASFESFLETARLKRDDEDAVFDDSEQTDVVAEREGMDVRDLNRLARDYSKAFGRSLPHPKMDAVVDNLATAWLTGKKALVFVRRVASVKELKQKLDERYDGWLIGRLRHRLPEAVRTELDAIVANYRESKSTQAPQTVTAPLEGKTEDLEIDDTGGNDTFFAWFFRGEGPKRTVSGANVQARFIQGSGAYATFFADNHVMELLGAPPGGVADALAAALGMSHEALVAALRARGARYLSKKAKRITRAATMEAAQGAALDLLREREGSPYAVQAEIIWEERYQATVLREHASAGPPEITQALERTTFFTELRLPGRAALRASIWPAPSALAEGDSFREHFREKELRAQFLATAARLGHAFIDLYVAAIGGRATLKAGRGDDDERDDSQAHGGADRLITDYIDLLEGQRTSSTEPWGAFHELSAIAENFDLIIDVNAPDARPKDRLPLAAAARYVASLLRQQQPIGGMAGQVNQTLVRQFRMPGYPLVLVTTDLLQEGEDLHTFCSAVHHYGISWTPSAMEQRIGRIDRVRSQTDRRLSMLDRPPTGDDWLQVFFPHLEDTVEVLQVERVLERMNTFLRLMHEGLAVPQHDERKIDVARELVAARRRVPAVTGLLKSAFPVPDWAIAGSKTSVAVATDAGLDARTRFAALRADALGGLLMEWAPSSPAGSLIGTARLASGRGQPFTLMLRSEQGHPVIRCISPVGRTEPETDQLEILERAARLQARIGAILTREARSYDLTVEDDVLLGDAQSDLERVGLLIARVVEQADKMEREHFEDGRDHPLQAFEEELREEGPDDV
jgi:hypothetical protein